MFGGRCVLVRYETSIARPSPGAHDHRCQWFDRRSHLREVDHAGRRGGDDRFVSPGTRDNVVDEQRHPLPNGEVGLISALTYAAGYHGQAELSAQPFYRDEHGDSRVTPGDLGRIEPDGSLTLLGRGSTVINTGGEKVHPEEVEDLIKTLPDIVDVIVRAVPDSRLGSVVGAVVQTAPAAALGADDIQQFVRQRLASYKAPRRVVFVKEIARHANGKVDATRLDQLLKEPSS